MSKLKYTKEVLEKAVMSNVSMLGMGWNRGLNHIGGTPKKSPEEILILKKDGLRTRTKQLGRVLTEAGKEYKCAKCELVNWIGLPVRLEIEHIIW
jgi:hypothetical protein